MIKSYEVVGYHYESVTYCKHCFEKAYSEVERANGEMDADLESQGGVIFADTEMEMACNCFTCGDEIDCTYLFEDDYDAWYDDAIHEFKTGEFWDDEYEFDYEICENGDVHLGGNAFHIIKGAVTSFENWKKL